MEISDEKLKNLLTNRNKNSAKRDTRPLKGRDLTINVHQGGIPKDHIIERILSV